MLDAGRVLSNSLRPSCMELALGRDRDPFDRAIAFMRERVATLAPLQGAVVSINGLATSLHVSQTPVREALATLAGEGLIVRTAAGYAGATHDPVSLAGLYDLAELLVTHAVRALDETDLDLRGPVSVEAALGEIVLASGHAGLDEAYRRVGGQLTPFVQAAATALGDREVSLARITSAFEGRDGRARAMAVRLPLQRRRKAAARILAQALGLHGRR